MPLPLPSAMVATVSNGPLRERRADFPVEVLLTPILIDERQLITAPCATSPSKADQKTQAALQQFPRHHSLRRFSKCSAASIRSSAIVAGPEFLRFPVRPRRDIQTSLLWESTSRPEPASSTTTRFQAGDHDWEALLFTAETLREGVHQQSTTVGTDSMDWLGYR